MLVTDQTNLGPYVRNVILLIGSYMSAITSLINMQRVIITKNNGRFPKKIKVMEDTLSVGQYE